MSGNWLLADNWLKTRSVFWFTQSLCMRIVLKVTIKGILVVHLASHGIGLLWWLWWWLGMRWLCNFLNRSDIDCRLLLRLFNCMSLLILLILFLFDNFHRDVDHFRPSQQLNLFLFLFFNLLLLISYYTFFYSFLLFHIRHIIHLIFSLYLHSFCLFLLITFTDFR